MTLSYQNAYYVVNLLNAILYGVELVLYFQTIQQMLDNRIRTFMDKLLIAVSTVQLILITIYWTTQAYFGQMMWIIHADYPGSMDAYFSDHASVWYQTWGTTSVIACNLIGDAVMLYRLSVIWDSRKIVILPALLWLASLASGIGLLYESGRPNGNYYAGLANAFGSSWGYLTFAFNVVVTSLICGRIVSVARSVPGSTGGWQNSTLGAVAILIESALPFTIFSLVYVILYAVGNDIAVVFSFYSMFTIISPQLITLRALSRRAWTRHTSKAVSTMWFQSPDPQTLNRTDSRITSPVELNTLSNQFEYGATPSVPDKLM